VGRLNMGSWNAAPAKTEVAVVQAVLHHVAHRARTIGMQIIRCDNTA
jgi:hypothetical protein